MSKDTFRYMHVSESKRQTSITITLSNGEYHGIAINNFDTPREVLADQLIELAEHIRKGL